MEKARKKRDIMNCWEFWGCSKEAKKQCPAYKARDGGRCWMYTHDLTPFAWANPPKKFKSCTQCPWCIKICKDTKKSKVKDCKDINKCSKKGGGQCLR